MIERAFKGKRYRVKSDSENNFEPGDIVIALETHFIPLCIKEEHFTNMEDCTDYSSATFAKYVYVLSHSELEELEVQ